MIDKNDVKMPVVSKETEEYRKDENMVKKIENLLDMISSTDNNQELRLKEDYYSRFHWFGNLTSRNDKSYFSYQEEAVYDFIFSLNKSGILSDQVGMGKTIEAGMIISELASRNELRSLLIIVPNEIMAKKWEDELESKFGIKEHEVRDITGKVIDSYPKVKIISNVEDFFYSIFNCSCGEKFPSLANYNFLHKYVASPKDTIESVIKGYIDKDIKNVVELLNEDFETNGIGTDYKVQFDGKSFSILGTDLSCDYSYDKKGVIETYLKRSHRGRIEDIVNNRRFVNEYKKLINAELFCLYSLIGKLISTIPSEIMKIATSMTSSNNYPILVIPSSYSEYKGDEVIHKDFLNVTLLKQIKNYKHQYITQDATGEIKDVFEDYRIIDFFIDVGYQMLIVDEVHDYINVCAKMNCKQYHNNVASLTSFSSSKYNRYELFDDYYFIEKSSLYKKLKNLADKANRKIFLTATPIKSDIVDFYLLSLLASNKDSEAYKKVTEELERSFRTSKEREDAISELYTSFKRCVEDTSARYFCENSAAFFKVENEEDEGKSNISSSRYKYPYFNNGFLKENINNVELIKKYLLGQIGYLSMEEFVLELILSYDAEMSDSPRKAHGLREIVEQLNDILSNEEGTVLQTRIVFRTLLNNSIKLKFEEDFIKEDGTPIKRIRELLELQEGPRKWHKTYRKYGIRHTRHQTYNLSDCRDLDKLSIAKRDRYKNLPVWPRRDGKVIFLLRDDVFFDSFLEVKREREEELSEKIFKEDLPNFDKMQGREEEKQAKFENAVNLFNYINDSMSGGDDVKHEPLNSKYESVRISDENMVQYKLALVNKLMSGSDPSLGTINNKVLLFAEKDREEILEWFRYQKCAPIYKGESDLDKDKAKEYKNKWTTYDVEPVNGSWSVTDKAEDLQILEGNVLIIVDPRRYEKGVDLQKADTIINFDINYCPLKMEQRIGRIDRIRPAGRSQEINIISFVPFNDMSGYVINFFANELKMFTQWMGETTGIVSVPEDSELSSNGVSFEDKVADLEKYYKDIYRLCTEDVSDAQLSEMINGKDATIKKDSEKGFKEFFFAGEAHKADEIFIDFEFIRKLRSGFDKIFRNSITRQREGYYVEGSSDRIIRFNSARNELEATCFSNSCEKCSNKKFCSDHTHGNHNNFKEFSSAVSDFFNDGIEFYEKKINERREQLSKRGVTGSANRGVDSLLNMLMERKENFSTYKDKVIKALPSKSDAPFTMPYNKFSKEIFNPIKSLYWDSVVNKYLTIILQKFHNQCDSVLKSAKLFEKFIKTLSIADFMNNMEGRV